jgi:hypothetical protein
MLNGMIFIEEECVHVSPRLTKSDKKGFLEINLGTHE